MVQLSEDGGIPRPSTSTHDRSLMMQPSQLTGDNRPGVNQHHTHLASVRPSVTLPSAQDHHRGMGSCGNGATSNGNVASGSSCEVSSTRDEMGGGMPLSVDGTSHFSSESRQAGNVKLRNEHPYLDLGRQPPPRGRWSYYEDLRARHEQVFLRDPKDERHEIKREPRDYRDRRELDRRDYRSHRDDKRDLGDYRVRRDLERRDLRDYRDRRDNRRDFRDERRYARDDRLDVRCGRRELRGEGGEPQRDARSQREDRGEGRDSREVGESHHQERKHEGERASVVDDHQVGDGQNNFSKVDFGSTPVKAEVFESKEADSRRSKDSNDTRERTPGAVHNRDRERNQGIDLGRGRNLGRDPEHEPLRREPVGEETGYESDHSRMSRTTAMTGYSTSSRSFNWRPRADSVASQASVFSHTSVRPPLTSGRGTRGK
ncbi:zinc finger CCCH domain-containing protein 13-like [Penaeus indicus]|uniref:zinc finger CCCH domain-containing protein 13-like n=1 Tax=Penaeus indicus TaxID=29960 RepID=UPI00300D3C93